MKMISNDPALTYTFDDFIALKDQDEMTYENFGIIRYKMQCTFVEQNILDYYLDELKKCSLKVTEFTQEEIVKYKYQPDLLAYDVYGSTQLDFVILLVNGIIDPKEFDFKRKYVLLPRKSILAEFLSRVYNSESDWIKLNRHEFELTRKEVINATGA